jgi:hypothetical protein
MVIAALAIAGVAAAIGSVVLHRAPSAAGSRRRRLQDSGWPIVLMVDGALLLATALLFAVV